MALTWDTYACRPLPMGGAGEVLARVPGAKQVKVLVGASAATSETDPLCRPVSLNLREDGIWRATFFGALQGNAVLSFFGMDGAVWVPGPIVQAVPLNWTVAVVFPWAKGWVISRLQEIAAGMPPFLDGRGLTVTGAFPRSGMGFPALVVQAQAQAQASLVVGDLPNGRIRSVNDLVKRTRQYSTALTVEVWALTPEDRDDLAEWMGQAMEVLMDACRHSGWEEPGFSMDESELSGGASGLEEPVFLATARLNLGAWSSISYPVSTFYGRLAVL